MDCQEKGKGCLVTVGTTQFDQLVAAAARREFSERLRDLGFRWLRIQVGRGIEPEECDDIPHFSRTWFRFTPDMPAEMRAATIIVSHGGAGSIMEALYLRKTLVVCVNDALMGNHQLELVLELHKRKHLVLATPELLAAAIAEATSDSAGLVPYPDYDPIAFPRFLDEDMRMTRERRNRREVVCNLS